jgi:arylsulfatase A-like enzyme
MLTGKYSHRHGVYENLFGDKEPFDGSQTTYPKLLREAGYRTAVVGKWHLKSDPTGFDYWNVLPFQGRYRDPRFIEMGEERTYEGHTTDVITELALETLRERLAPDRPFCLMVHHKAPHRRWVPAPRHRELYEGFDQPVPPTFNDDYWNRSGAASHADMRVADMPDWEDEQPEGMDETARKHWNWQRYIKEYLRTIAGVDESVGRLLDYLEAAGRDRDTVVVYTTDNGFFLGQHGWFDKRFMYEESLRIPLLVRWPGRAPAGRTVDDMALNLDFAETFLDMAGVRIPEEMQGRSLVPLLRGDRPDTWRRSMYYHYYEYPGPHTVRPHYGVRTRRHKLIRYYTIDEWELFDLKKDPWELNSVHEATDYREVRRELVEEIGRLRRRFGDDTGAPLRG